MQSNPTTNRLIRYGDHRMTGLIVPYTNFNDIYTWSKCVYCEYGQRTAPWRTLKMLRHPKCTFHIASCPDMIIMMLADNTQRSNKFANNIMALQAKWVWLLDSHYPIAATSMGQGFNTAVGVIHQHLIMWVCPDHSCLEFSQRHQGFGCQAVHITLGCPACKLSCSLPHSVQSKLEVMCNVCH